VASSRSCKGGRFRRTTAKRWYRSPRNRLSRTHPLRSAWVAVMSLTSTDRSATAPKHRTRLASMAVSNLPCRASGKASISSNSRVPPEAASTSPGLARLASVKAPAATPYSSASSCVSGIAAQLISMKGPWARGPLSWMIRATKPFPVPVSPRNKTVGTCG
jgi:hypothetical protein